MSVVPCRATEEERSMCRVHRDRSSGAVFPSSSDVGRGFVQGIDESVGLLVGCDGRVLIEDPHRISSFLRECLLEGDVAWDASQTWADSVSGSFYYNTASIGPLTGSSEMNYYVDRFYFDGLSRSLYCVEDCGYYVRYTPGTTSRNLKHYYRLSRVARSMFGPGAVVPCVRESTVLVSDGVIRLAYLMCALSGTEFDCPPHRFWITVGDKTLTGSTFACASADIFATLFSATFVCEGVVSQSGSGWDQTLTIVRDHAIEYADAMDFTYSPLAWPAIEYVASYRSLRNHPSVSRRRKCTRLRRLAQDIYSVADDGEKWMSFIVGYEAYLDSVTQGGHAPANSHPALDYDPMSLLDSQSNWFGFFKKEGHDSPAHVALFDKLRAMPENEARGLFNTLMGEFSKNHPNFAEFMKLFGESVTIAGGISRSDRGLPKEGHETPYDWFYTLLPGPLKKVADLPYQIEALLRVWTPTSVFAVIKHLFWDPIFNFIVTIALAIAQAAYVAKFGVESTFINILTTIQLVATTFKIGSSIDELIRTFNMSSQSSGAATIITTLLAKIGVVGFDGPTVLRDLVNISRASSVVDVFFDSLTYVLKLAIDWMPGCDASLGCSSIEYDKFSEEMDSINDEVARGTFGLCLSNMERLESMVRRGTDLAKRLNGTKHRYEAATIMKMIESQRKLLASIRSQMGRGHIRPQPVLIGLFGPPNQGKTGACDYLAMDYLSRALGIEANERSVGSLIFTKNTDPYWEGVRPETQVVIFDDFGQARESEGKESQYETIIHLVNEHGYNPNMAFADKGKISLRPGLVLMSSNLTRFQSSVINEMKAFTRRFTDMYQVVLEVKGVKPERSNWKFHRVSTDASGNLIRSGDAPVTYEYVLSQILNQRADNELAYQMKSAEMYADVPIEKLFETSSNDGVSEPEGDFHWEQEQFPLIPRDEAPLFAIYIEKWIEGRDLIEAWTSIHYSQKVAITNRLYKEWKESSESKLPAPEWGDTLRKLCINPYVIGASVGLAVIGAAGYFIKPMVSQFFQQTVQSVNPKNNMKYMQFTPRAPKTTQGAASRDLVDLMANNQYEIWLKVKGSTTRIGYCLALDDSRLIGLLHFENDLCHFALDNGADPKDVAISLRRGDLVFHTTPNECFTDYYEDKDLVVFHAKTSSKDIKKHFAPARLFLSAAGHRWTDKRYVGHLLGSNVFSFEDARFVAGMPHPDTKVFIRNIVQYSAPTVGGDCGRPLVLVHNNTAYIAGLHMAGAVSRGIGYATALSDEDICRLLGEPAPEVYDKVDLKYDKKLVTPQAQYSAPRPSSTTSKCDITPIGCDFIPRKTKVTVRNSETYDKSLTKFITPTSVDCDLVGLRACVAEVFRELRDVIGTPSASIYSFSEALFGVPNSCFDSLPSSTSPGYPYNAYGKRKRDYFVDGRYAKHIDDLMSDVHSFLTDLNNGVAPLRVFTDIQKVERLPVEKVDSGKCRLVSAAPLDLTIVTRMFFGPFVEAITSKPISSGTAVAFNPYKDAGDLVTYLEEVDPGEVGFGAGDYSGFDASEVPLIHDMILKGINDWFNDDYSEEREILWTYVTRSVHIRGDKIRFWNKSLPSGHPLTTIINCLYNKVAIMYAWFKSNDSEYRCLAHFRQHVRLVVLGDDNIFSVSRAAQEVFSERTIAKYVAELGLKYTSDDKVSDIVGLRPMSEVTFLKRRFCREGPRGIWVMPLDLDVVLETVIWTRRGQEREVLRSNLLMVARELSLHGEDVFHAWIHRIVKWSEMEGVVSLDWFTNFELVTSGKVIDAMCQSVILSESASWRVDTGGVTGAHQDEIETPDLTEHYKSLEEERLSAASQSSGLTNPNWCGGGIWQPPLEPSVDMLASGMKLTTHNPLDSRTLPGVFTLTNQDGKVALLPVSRESQSGYPKSGNTRDIRTAATLSIEEQANPTGSLGQDVLSGGDVNQSTTRFTSDTGVVIAGPTAVKGIDLDIVESCNISGSEDVVGFVKRPWLLTKGSFTTADPLGVLTRLGDLPSALLNTNATLVAKLARVFLARMDMVVTLTVNATRFQQGRYILAWLPYGGLTATGQTAGDKSFLQHAFCLATITQLPHIEIDISQQSTVQLRIPFSSADMWYQLRNPTVQLELGTLFLATYSPLVAASGLTSADWSVYVSFENAQFSGITTQGGWSVRKEQKNLGIAPLSEGLGTVAKGMAMLGRVPVIGPAAGAVSWAADVMAYGAKSLGFSKPNVLSAPSRVHRSAAVYDTNADGAITGQPMGVWSTNEVVAFPGLGTSSIDQMSIDFIKGRFGYVGNFSWSTANASGTTLYQAGHNPYSYPVGVDIGFVFPPVTMLARSFAMWRGSLRFRFKLVKTEFHSGRIVVAYNSFDGRQTSLVPTLAQTDSLWREIIDIRETSEFEVCVPYVSGSAWRFSQNSDTVGLLTVHVLDALQAPNTVASSVTVLVEIAGGDDFDVAVPQGDVYVPYVPLAVKAQSGYKVIECDDLGKSKLPSTIRIHETTVGEKIGSIRSLLKGISRECSYSTKNPTTTIGVPATSYITVYPFVLPLPVQTAAAAPYLNKSIFLPDRITLWSYCYLYSTGSVRFRIEPDVSFNSDAQIFLNNTGPQDLYSTDLITNYAVKSWANTHSASGTIEGNIHDFVIPTFNHKLARVNASLIANTSTGNVGVINGASGVAMAFSVIAGSSPAYSASVSRSAGDDFALFGWLGTVPMVSRSTN